MKKINKYSRLLFLLLILATITSCKKNFLDKQPLDQISTATFYKSAADAQQGLTGVYSTLTYGYNGYSKVYLDCLSDNAYHQFNYNNLTNMAEGSYDSQEGVVYTVWQSNYQGIAQCNLFLQAITTVSMDAATETEYIAEVKCLRAFFYFNLVNRFGDVILYTTAPTLSGATNPIARSPKAQVLAFIKSDLDFAIANLPDNAYTGHVVKGTALGLEAKMDLFNQDYADAVTLTSQIMSGGKFSLYPNYQGLFFRKNQDNNPEIMFSTNYLAPNDEQGFPYNGIDIEIGYYAAIDPYQEMVDTYETSSGKLITDPTSGYSSSNQYANRDPRLHASIRGSDQVWHNPDGSIFVNSNPSPTLYQMCKYIDTTLFPIAYGNLNQNDEDIIHLRYADVLLMYAEAKNELSGPDATVYSALNQIRARVSMPPVDQSLYGSQTTLRTFIRHERRVELAFEGQRYDDIVRWQIATQVMPAVVIPGGGVTVVFKPNFYLWPLPQQDISLDPLLKQNPGY